MGRPGDVYGRYEAAENRLRAAIDQWPTVMVSPTQIMSDAEMVLCDLARHREWQANRSWATVYERTAWKHDIGEHAGSEHPYAYCPRCEMEHPEGRFAQLTADAASARSEAETLRGQADALAEALRGLLAASERLDADLRSVRPTQRERYEAITGWRAVLPASTAALATYDAHPAPPCDPAPQETP